MSQHLAYNEAETRAKLIDPALRERGWTEDHLKREENAGGIYLLNGKPRQEQKFVDYVLRLKVGDQPEPVAVALIEAKKNTLPAAHGLEQAKQYAAAKRLNVPFVYSSNGYQFVEFDKTTGLTSPPRPMSHFPTVDDLRRRYEAHKGFSLDTPAAKPLLTPYTGGDSIRRYYQDAAIRAVLEKIAAGETRALLSLATGAGKTHIAVHLLKRIADASQLRRVLFVCDRTELRDQAHAAFHNVFGNEAQVVTAGNPQKNARILIATYQTLNVDSDQADANFFTQHYPENYFSHILIDECHRSAWGKWSIVLTHNPAAIQVGLTATPRQLRSEADTAEGKADAAITANNIAYFGEPVYEYDMSQGIADGYLAACDIRQGRVNLDDTGISLDDIIARQPIDALTGQPVSAEYLRQLYEKSSFEDAILLPDRVLAMTDDLFRHLLETGGPHQKTIIFCVKDDHADRVAIAMNNLYKRWCADHGQPPADNYAFKCTAASSGNDMLPDFKGKASSDFIATTVDLLTTGVDVPRVTNIVFFRYVRSPISFYQMVGRGTRLFVPDNKLLFRVYDYTDATRLFGEEFITAAPSKSEGDGTDTGDPPPRIPNIEVVGFDVRITDAGRYIVTQVNGKATPVTVEEYKQQLTARLVQAAPTLPAFRQVWVEPDARKALLLDLPANGQSALLVRELEAMNDYDLFDVLAGLGYGLAPRTRRQRADAFTFKQATWLNTLPPAAAATIRALAGQFAAGGTEELESQFIWQVEPVKQAGGLLALRGLPQPPVELLRETKVRIFAA